MQRSPALSNFIAAFLAALPDRVRPSEPAGQLVNHVTGLLRGSAGKPVSGAPNALPACRYLDAALSNADRGPVGIRALAGAMRALAPRLVWQHRAHTASDSPSFHEGHANTYFVGPDGLECRGDVVVGASLLAPHTVYPDHKHPPREVYLVMSEGDWFNTEAGWYTPGMGSIVYHPSGITHAMRSGPAPLLAVWCLWPETALG